MLEKMNLSAGQVIGYEVNGDLTAEDYQKVITPLLEQFDANGKKVRCLLYFGPRFTGFTMAAGWEDFKVGLHHMHTFDRCAVVSDLTWLRGALQVFSPLFPFPVGIYDSNQLETAKSWIAS